MKSRPFDDSRRSAKSAPTSGDRRKASRTLPVVFTVFATVLSIPVSRGQNERTISRELEKQERYPFRRESAFGPANPRGGSANPVFGGAAGRGSGCCPPHTPNAGKNLSSAGLRHPVRSSRGECGLSPGFAAQCEPVPGDAAVACTSCDHARIYLRKRRKCLARSSTISPCFAPVERCPAPSARRRMRAVAAATRARQGPS